MMKSSGILGLYFRWILIIYKTYKFFTKVNKGNGNTIMLFTG